MNLLTEKKQKIITSQPIIVEALLGLVAPLRYLGIDWFKYGTLVLDKVQHCDGITIYTANPGRLEWLCQNASHGNFDFVSSMRKIPLNATSYFIVPSQSNDFVIQAYQALFGMKNCLIVYKRSEFCINSWSFGTTNDHSILDSQLNDSTIRLFKEYIRCFDTQLSGLELPPPFIPWEKRIDLSFEGDQSSNLEAFLKTNNLQAYPLMIKGQQVFFSKREIECLRGITELKQIKEIAKNLGVSHRTIEECMRRIKTKTGCSLRSDLSLLYADFINRY